MPRVVRVLIVCAVSLLAAASRNTVRAQTPAPAADEARIWQGVYTATQAERGKAGYAAYCTRCHGLDLKGRQGVAPAPALAGESFWLSWERSTIAALLRKVSGQMPADAPASLRDDEYVDIVSYILSSNAIPAGKVELPPASAAAALNAMKIIRQTSNAASAPNFSLVRVVGCLSQDATGAWMLTRGSAPVVVQEPAASAAVLKEAGAMAPGTETFLLLGARGLRPDSYRGQRIEARGLINRGPGENRLDLLSLSSIGVTCVS